MATRKYGNADISGTVISLRSAEHLTDISLQPAGHLTDISLQPARHLTDISLQPAGICRTGFHLN